MGNKWPTIFLEFVKERCLLFAGCQWQASEGHVLTNPENLPVLLIAEDNEELRNFLSRSLEHHYRVVKAENGLNAWDIILEELPDVILSDVMMPGMDGFALSKQVKSDIRTSHICLILLTSRGSYEAKMQGLEAGADDYISKPFHLAELELRIANLLQQQQKTRTHHQSQLRTGQQGETKAVVEDPFLKRLYEELETRLDDPKLGVDQLSEVMLMSRSTLNRKLRSLLDISTNDLVRQYRLKKGAELLAAGMDITSVAYKVGFSSPSYFTQRFREQYGLTPTEYMARSSTKEDLHS